LVMHGRDPRILGGMIDYDRRRTLLKLFMLPFTFEDVRWGRGVLAHDPIPRPSAFAESSSSQDAQ
jgi:hypothetical protein